MRPTLAATVEQVDPLAARQRIVADLTARFCARRRHGNSTQLAHLVAVDRVLTGWRQPMHVQLAGLIHSVYSTETYHVETYSRDERAHVASLVGVEAERLAYQYCAIRNRALYEATALFAGKEPEVYEFEDRFYGDLLHLMPQNVADILMIHLANLATQGAGPEGRPLPWLARAARLSAWASPRASVAPPVFAGGRFAVSEISEHALLAAYDAALGAGPQLQGRTLQALFEAVVRAPVVGEPMLLLAASARATGEIDSARSLAAAGKAVLLSWGVPWDKERPISFWLDLAARLEAGPIASLELYGLAGFDLPARVPIVRTNQPPQLRAEAPLPDRFAWFIGQLRNPGEERLRSYPGLRQQPVHSPERFALVRDLEKSAPAIIKEFEALDERHFFHESEPIGRLGAWEIVTLFERGRKRDEICEQCPVTTSVLEMHPAVRSLSGLIYFSRLAPGTRVAPHAGPTNMRLRCHLGIKIPDRCGLSVDGINLRWEESRCLVFDDSLLHSVWNDDEYDRVVLVVDIWHPDLTADEIALLDGLQRHAVTQAVRNTRYLERNEKARRIAAAGVVDG